ncbi:MAG: hypothetical protein GXO91_02025 [FCB group bacterium]|nr:hypothetical protein [FCB group bacterium]
MWTNLIKIWTSNDLLKQAWEQSFEMLKIDELMFREAQRVLRESDSAEADIEIREKDKLVNKYEREVRKKVMTHCAVQTSYGLAEGLALVSIVIDIERIGDYTKNIMDMAVNHPHRLEGKSYEKDLQKIEKAVKVNFEKVRKILKTSNAEEALELIRKYRWVNPLCDERMVDVLKEKDKSITPGESAALALYFRWLKRIYAHLRNVTTSVINPFDKIGFKPKKKYLS